MLKRLVRGALGRAGWELRRVPPARPAETWGVPPAELAERDRLLEEFARLAPDCEPWGRPDRAREYLSERRLAFFRDLLDRCEAHGVRADGRSAGDVGAGTGWLLRLLHQRAPTARLAGYDSYAEILRLARHLCPQGTFVECDALAGVDARHDVVFCTEVLEHLAQPADALRTLLAMLAPGGTLVLTVPDGRRDSFPALEPYPNGRGYWGHINFWSPESWRLFVATHAAGRAVACGTLRTGENWAIVEDRAPTIA